MHFKYKMLNIRSIVYKRFSIKFHRYHNSLFYEQIYTYIHKIIIFILIPSHFYKLETIREFHEYG